MKLAIVGWGGAAMSVSGPSFLHQSIKPCRGSSKRNLLGAQIGCYHATSRATQCLSHWRGERRHLLQHANKQRRVRYPLLTATSRSSYTTIGSQELVPTAAGCFCGSVGSDSLCSPMAIWRTLCATTFVSRGMRERFCKLRGCHGVCVQIKLREPIMAKCPHTVVRY